MAQDTGTILPNFLNTDTAFDKINADETIYSKGVDLVWNLNGGKNIGTSNPSGNGQNDMALTPSRSNVAIPNVLLPSGYNKNNGAFDSVVTQETYVANYNSNGNHGWYVYNGNTGVWSKIIVDPKLSFSNNPKHYISAHRVNLRVLYDEKGDIVEKYLFWTDGQVWQGFISVNAAISTNGFDSSLYPYWVLQPPHFDREELFQLATRPIMYNPAISKIPNTESDAGSINMVLDSAFQFCANSVYTDGRVTTISPFSLPEITKTTDFLNNPDLIPKKYLISLYAGSCMGEKINIYFRKTVTGKNQTDSDLTTWTDWYLYDTIYKYSDCGNSTNNIIGTEYWKRVNPWAGYNYNPQLNTIQYVFDNSKVAQIIEQDLFNREQTALPQLSVGLNNAGDSALLANNRYGYDNFSCSTTSKLTTKVIEGSLNSCALPTRKIRLYVYVARSRGNISSDQNDPSANQWLSQVGYHIGTDPQMRFGGISIAGPSGTVPSLNVNIDTKESKYFGLDFADKDSFRVYLKGTPYFADGIWYQVNNDANFSLTKLSGLLDSTNTSDVSFIETVYGSGGFFVGVFDISVPAGKYIATLGRHNVSSDGDYVDTSTYIMGIANSRNVSNWNNGGVIIRNVKSNAIVSTSKEMEIDCTNGDVDVWGNGSDLFYVFTPFFGIYEFDGFLGVKQHLNYQWSFVEGYLYEQNNFQGNGNVPVERFPYNITGQSNVYSGVQTDKNGFFWGYCYGGEDSGVNNNANIKFTTKLNCQYPVNFTVNNNAPNSASWKQNNIAYVSDLNPITAGVFGTDNYVLVRGRVTDVTGLIGYSNVGVSIKDGMTDYTDNNGYFTLIVHNGFLQSRTSNIYINAGGDFVITTVSCGTIPLLYYDESLIPCGTTISKDPCTGQSVTPARYFPTCFRLNVNIESGGQQSLKQSSSYTTVIIGADKAGRRTFANKVSDNTVQSFLQRNDTTPTHFQWGLSGALGLNGNTNTKDIAWVCFGVSIPNRKYIQWVGDSIQYIDINGKQTLNTNNAVLVQITISSLLEANIQNNFTLISTYQFVKNDRLRIYDNGAGVLFDTATYGSPIDVEVQGTNYNQAAVNANLIIPPENTVLPNNQTVGDNPTTIFVQYDSRFDKLIGDTGFWIELYTPLQTNDKLPYREDKWYPVINGEIAVYLGGGQSNPQYDYPTSADMDYWDTYLNKRVISIPNVGSNFFSHPFESPNITDSWGANVSSGGLPNAINTDAKQIWIKDNTIRSADFVSSGIVNGLGFWIEENKKNFKGFNRGGIVAIICSYNYILFVCENDWFVTDYNYNYIFANAQGVQVANLDNNLGEPHQRIGDVFGCAEEDTQTVMMFDKYVWWHDRKSEAWVLCNYSSAKDVTELKDKEGVSRGIKSYIIEKIKFITNWNNNHDLSSIFDIICGIDEERNNIYCTYRPRRKNTARLTSFVSDITNFDIRNQETFVYNLDSGRWIPLANFCPESYSKIQGDEKGMQMVTFAAGKPYIHNASDTFLNYYGIQTQPVITGVFNKGSETIKIFQSIMLDILNNVFYVDMVYENENNSYSYIPLNKFVTKEKMTYAALLRDMTSYFAPNPDATYRSTLIDGKRIMGRYCIIRFIGVKNEYFQLNSINYLFTQSAPNKP